MSGARDRLNDSHSPWSSTTAILVVCFVCALAIRELRVQRFTPSPAVPVTAAIAIPGEGVSISMLRVSGRIVRVGELAADAVSSLATSAVLRLAADDAGTVGRRQIRSYDLDGASVTVVLEPFETRGALRVAAIYLR